MRTWLAGSCCLICLWVSQAQAWDVVPRSAARRAVWYDSHYYGRSIPAPPRPCDDEPPEYGSEDESDYEDPYYPPEEPPASYSSGYPRSYDSYERPVREIRAPLHRAVIVVPNDGELVLTGPCTQCTVIAIENRRLRY